jgi:hypothetical protein
MAFRLALWGRQAWRAHKAKEFDNSYRNFKPEFTLFFDRDLYFDNGMHSYPRRPAAAFVHDLNLNADYFTLRLNNFGHSLPIGFHFEPFAPLLVCHVSHTAFRRTDTLRATLLVQSQERFRYPVLSVALVCHWESSDATLPIHLRSTTLYSHKKVLGGVRLLKTPEAF